MNTLQPLIKRAKRFTPTELVRESKLDRKTVYTILNGLHDNPTARTTSRLQKAVERLESRKLSIKKGRVA